MPPLLYLQQHISKSSCKIGACCIKKWGGVLPAADLGENIQQGLVKLFGFKVFPVRQLAPGGFCYEASKVPNQCMLLWRLLHATVVW